MNTCKVEAEAIPQILTFLQRWVQRVDSTDKDAFLQAIWGDFTVYLNGLPYGIELKVEQSNKWSNFYLETWSNREWFTLGWLYKLQADTLLYFFIEQKTLYSIRVPALKQWAFGVGDGQGNIYKYPERKQSKYNQKNDTWGRCVPIAELQKALGDDIKYYQLP